jgi:hypothetical protein
MGHAVNSQKLTVLTQDPGVRIRGRLAVSQVDVPAERLAIGPTGYRIKVVDFDAGANVLYTGRAYSFDEAGLVVDPYAPPDPAKVSAKSWKAYETRLLGDPRFHAQNVYAIAMRTVAAFEKALGRRVEWGFRGHQLHIAPHAFADANAFYSELDQCLMFGYFAGRSGATVFTCLSHDIIAHETTHALLDGLRDSFTEPSTPDQAAFHEAFSDIVALLSVFSLPETVKACLLTRGPRRTLKSGSDLVPARFVDKAVLKQSLLLGLGKQFGRELQEVRGDALRRSVELPPRTDYLSQPGWDEPHQRGEVLSAAFLNAFVDIWSRRIEELGTFTGGYRNLDAVVEEGSKVAGHLLTMAIRALDYCPPVDLSFSSYLSSLLTADTEVAPDDSRFHYRDAVRAAFASYGIEPPRASVERTSGRWLTWDEAGGETLIYSRSHFESMLRDKEEVFRFVWENRAALDLDARGNTRVNAVRAATRVGPDGLMLRETVVEYVQQVRMFGAEVTAILGCPRPAGMPTTQPLSAYGGGTLVFDQYGRVKYHVAHPLRDPKRQQERLDYLWNNGFFDQTDDRRSRFATLHRRRALG